MLQHTFCHVRGIGPGLEARLWEAGLSTWSDFLSDPAPPVPRPRRPFVREALALSLERQHDARYFAATLPGKQHWRLLPDFSDQVAYLDIETEGLSKERCGITTIAVYDGHEVKTYVRGKNLDDFPADIKRYGLLVTYNGSQFDLPMLAATFGLNFDQAHIDLRFALKEVGVTGGLKKCEKHFCLDRGALTGLDGFAAVILWQQYIRYGSKGALQTLLAYNVADVLSLELLAVHAYNMLLSQLGHSLTSPLPMPALAANPYQADPKVLKRLPKHLFE